MMKLSDNLRQIRKENNLSQEQLAEKLGVSRQAVSKWESGQSYPEMDKVLLICKLFNYNIDELMYENVKEVNETKQSKININKYIDDFFGFITKTVDVFCAMRFRDRIKCVLEIFLMAIFLFAIYLVLSAIGGSLFANTFGALPYNIYRVIRNILEAICTILYLVISVTVLLHIFKTRYLDYYEIVKKDAEEIENNETIELDNGKKKVFIEKNKEKIIIRDPGHSQSKFLNGIARIILWCIKFIAACIALGFAFTFVTFSALLVLSFLFVKTGELFIGAFLGLIAASIINFIILESFYNFIVSKKSKKNRMAIMGVIALGLAGASIGLIFVGITNFNYVEENINTIKEVYSYEMTNNFDISVYGGKIQYIETDSDKVRIVVEHSKYYNIDIADRKDNVRIYCYQDSTKIMEAIRDGIKDINNKEIKSYNGVPVAYIYTSKENIRKMQKDIKIIY